MTDRMINNRCRKLQALKAQIEELQEQADRIEEEIKKEIGDAEELRTGAFLIRWSRYTSTRIDGKRLREELPDVYGRYSRQITARRFSIA